MSCTPRVWTSLAAVCLTGAAASADVTRTLEARLDGDPTRPFAIENLAGTMRVVAGHSGVRAVATVHAGSSALAEAVRFEQVAGKGGIPTLRVRYPVDQHKVYRYPASHREDSEGFGEAVLSFFGGGSGVEYDGARVRVSSSRGAELYADVEIEVPEGANATFRNRVGPASGSDVSGTLTFDTADGDVTLERVRGAVVADTGSGNVRASALEGSFSCDTGSGRCTLSDFKGESLNLDTGSGEVRVTAAAARRIRADTGSGNVYLLRVDAEEIRGDTGSGSVELDSSGDRLRSVKADTGSGSVTLRLGKDASFEAHASLGSGRIVNRYEDASPILKGHEVVGYKRGEGKARILVDTGSGNLVLEPSSRR